MLLYILALLPFVMFCYMVIDFSGIDKKQTERHNEIQKKIIEARRREREADQKRR